MVWSCVWSSTISPAKSIFEHHCVTFWSRPSHPHLLVFMSSPLSSGDITELYEFSQNHPHIESPLWNLTARDNRSFTELENIYFWSREKCPRHCLLSEDINIKYYINNVVQYYDIPANKLHQWNIPVFMTEIAGQLEWWHQRMSDWTSLSGIIKSLL